MIKKERLFDKGDTVEIMQRRYILAITIIATLVISTHFIMEFTTKKSEFDSRIINIAGRQRMLSQKITKCVFGLYNTKEISEKKKYIEEINGALDLWTKSHYGLKNGDKKLGLPGNNSKTTTQLFEIIENPFNIIVDRARKVAAEQTNENKNSSDILLYLEEIRQNELLFLPTMDKIVFQYDAEAKEKVKSTERLSLLLGLLTLFVLAMEAIFIFKPLENKVSEAIDYLIENEENLQKLFDVAPQIMFLVSSGDYTILRLNQIAGDTIGVNFDDAINKKLTEYIDAESLKRIEILDENKYSGHIDNIEVELKKKNGDIFYMLMSVSRMFYHHRSIFLVGLTDISRQKKQEEELNYFATVDEMTKLVNRRAGLLILSKEFENARRHKYPLTIAFIDVDGLKKVNDTYGHENGDFLIKSVAETIIRNIRTGDVALRYGGDEIIVILHHCKIDLAEIVMDRITLDIEMLNKTINKPFKIGMSCGLVELEDTIEDSDEMIKRADTIMYASKIEKKR